MCGLVGLINRSPNAEWGSSGQVGALANTLNHRGPDDFGVWMDAQVGIALAHRRLAILDLSSAGHQPMVSSCGRWVLIFNGEIYNHLVLREELGRIHRYDDWHGHSDTETLLAAFSNWGIDEALSKVKGMFALALWDRLERVLTLARDRMGEKPLYYGWQQGVFLFGSELKSIKAHPAFQGEIDRDAIVLLLRHNSIPAPKSIYNSIYKLPPGTYVQLRPDNLGQEELLPKKYWSLIDCSERGERYPFLGTDYEAIDRLDDLLGASVHSQLLSDVPLWALLSGGVDSSLIVSLMQKYSSKPVQTFTIGFAERSFDEAANARAVAKHLGCVHTELVVGSKDALNVLSELPQIYDEPFADSSQIPTYLVMKMIRQHVTVALSGDAGDELFGGYGRYTVAPVDWHRISRIPLPLRYVIGKGLCYLSPGRLQRLGKRMLSSRNIDDWGLSMITQWGGAENLVIGSKNPGSFFTDRKNWPNLGNPISRMMVLDALTYLPDDILVKVDRAAMAVSLETRIPFLDKDVVEFAYSLPMHLKIRKNQGKWIVRQLLYRYIPPVLVNRPKRGFAIPLDAWLREPLRDWAENLLAENRLIQEGFFEPQPIRRAWRQHLQGKVANGHQLWSVLMFQAWYDRQMKS